MVEAAPKRKRRRFWVILLATTATVLTAAVAALPWMLGTPPVLRLLLAQANAALAPGAIELTGLRLSWFGTTRMTGLVLRDPRGKRVLVAPRVSLDRSVWRLLSDRSQLGTLTLDGAALDIERRADGSIDLADVFGALLAEKPDPHPNPGPGAKAEADPSLEAKGAPMPSFTLRVVRGTLALRSPELAEPLTAGRVDFTLQNPAAPGGLAWKLALANGVEAGTETLEVSGRCDLRARAGTQPDLELSLSGCRWPLAGSVAGVLARGRLDGKIEARRQEGHWAFGGAAKVLDLDAAGVALAGDRLRIDRIDGTWDLAQDAGAWAIRRFDATCPLATLAASGTIAETASASARVEGHLDLAALARQLPHALRLRDGLALERGSAHVRVDLRSEADAPQRLDVEARVSDLIARDGAKTITLRDPATLSASLTRRDADLRVPKLELKTAFLDATGSGDLDRGVTLAATFNFGEFQAQLRDLIDFGGLGLSGQGRLAANYRRAESNYVGRLAAEVRALRVVGLASDPVARDFVRLDASASGPASESGLPLSWENARVNLNGDDVAARVSANTREGVTTVSANASAPYPFGAVEGRADGKLTARWSERLLEIDEVRLGLRPADPKLAARSINLAGKGRLNLGAGELTLGPIPGTAPGAIGLGPEGVRVRGLGQSASGRRVEASLVGDLAALDQASATWVGGDAHGLAGSWDVQITVEEGDQGRRNFGGTAKSLDLSLPGGDGKGRRVEGPIALALGGAYQVADDRVDLTSLVLASRYAVVSASGRLAEPAGRRVADLQGTLTPNWDSIKKLAEASIEPGASLTGNPRAFRIKGPISGGAAAEILKGLDAELGIDLAEAQAFGMRVGPAPIVVRCGGGRVAIDPIATTLNGGRVALKPEIVLDDPKGMALRLASGSAIEGAEINQEVSRRVLSFVVPALNDAAQVRGHLSVAIDRAEFPIGGSDGRTSNVAGRVDFQDVVFEPGPSAAPLLSLAGKGQTPALRLHQPVVLTVADGRVTQSGLVIPLGGSSRLELGGSVGFDETLALRAVVPVSGATLGDQAKLGQDLDGTRIVVPIGGTIAKPTIDARALRLALQELSKTVLKREVTRDASEVLDRIVRPSGESETPRSPDGLPATREAQKLGEDLLRRLVPR
ncbi:MAG: hypothetical protein JOZ63_02235 [Planctomycetaceae bacterium]|nr:hypothetical protein [Planctomycetaceae bacterium]